MQQNNWKQRVRFSVMNALYFAIVAVTTYQTVYLQEAGLSSSQIGSIVAAASFLGLIVIPVWGIVSDMLHSAKVPFLLCVLIMSVLYFVMPILERGGKGNVVFFSVLIPVIYLFKQPTNSMLDSWSISELTPLKVGYGQVRMWGSIGFAVVSAILGVTAGKVINVSFLFYLMLPLAVMMYFVGRKTSAHPKGLKCRMPGRGYFAGRKMSAQAEQIKCGMPERVSSADAEGSIKKENKRSGREKVPVGKLFENRSLITYLIYALGLNIYTSVTLIFMPYILEAAGCKPEQIGLVTGFRALMEILSMYVGSRLAGKIALRYIMILPGILFGLEQMFYRFAGNLFHILFIMVLSGLAGGFAYSLGPSYIYEIVPKEVVSTAQSCNAMILTITGIAGSAAGGYIIREWGIYTFTTGCAIFIGCLTVFFAVSLRIPIRAS